MKKEPLHNEQLGYHTPEGYFDQSKKEMLRFLETQKPVRKSNAPIKRFVTGLGMIAIVIIGVFTYNNTQYSNDSFENLTIESLEVSEEEFEQWFDENFVLNDM